MLGGDLFPGHGCLAYNYPGNVRELKNAMERAVLLSTGNRVDVTHLPSEFRQSAENLPCFSENLSLDEGAKCYERRRIMQALDETDWKKVAAADKLGISRKVLWKKIKDLDIEG